MERFVQSILMGGFALVVGLWITTLGALASPTWLVGAALTLLGILGLSAGIWREIDIAV